tara:strand:- start:1651 stop:4860 length:3210 start_codon:yes stop_codon:yes gene_type:complete
MATAQAPKDELKNYDLSSDKVLYTIGYSHLDTEWNWDYPTVVGEYIKNIMTENFYLFEKYPEYRYNFTGSRRYRMMKEYFPDLYETVKKYIASGQWYVAGSSVDEAETVVSSPESIVRQTLYGNRFFQTEFGKTSMDYMLPDCFGFPASLPTIVHHSGLLGFSTQKLSWGSAVGVPFNIGNWIGPDGSQMVSALNPGAYVSHVENRLDKDEKWTKRLEHNKEVSGYAFDYKYYGVGDQGGAPRENDVYNAVESLHNSDSNFKVLLTSSDQMFKDVTPAIKESLPTYTGDLLLTEHSAGSITSQAFMKKMNRKNELLAKATEPLAAIADWQGRAAYPFTKLNKAWELVLGNQMHDILPGTSIPSVYEYAWNDELMAASSFATVLENSMEALVQDMDTRVKGRAVVVYNPVETHREDIAKVKLAYAKMPPAVAVYDGNTQVKSQVIQQSQDSIELIFETNMQPLALKVYDVRPVRAVKTTSALKVTTNMLENTHYRVTLNAAGDIASFYDKQLDKELLSAPTRLDFQTEASFTWPAWNMMWDERQKPPFAVMDEAVDIKVVEEGPLRVALEVTREGQHSTLVQTISLAAGEAGKRLQIANLLTWKSSGMSLKAAFPLAAKNEKTTYSWQVGTIERGVNSEKKYEVPSKQWFDQTDASGDFGISILEDSKYGSDKPDANELRLTLMFTPKVKERYVFQNSQDWGMHTFTYALYGHKGNWQEGLTPWQGKFVNQPLLAFESPQHRGSQGAEFSMLDISAQNVGLMAFKKSEDGKYLIIRVNEILGKDAQEVQLTLPGTIAAAHEVNGQEQEMGDVSYAGNTLTFDINKYGIKAFAVRLEKEKPARAITAQQPVALPYNLDAFSHDTNRNDGALEDRYSMPAELIPAQVVSEDIVYTMGTTQDREDNAVRTKGQIIDLPKGDYNTVYILAAATQKTTGDFTIDGIQHSLEIDDWSGKMGQWYNRDFVIDRIEHKVDIENVTVKGIESPYVNTSNIAWFATHRHLGYPSTNMVYEYSYLYSYAIPVPKGAKQITLPDNSRIRVFAITVAKDETAVLQPLQPLYEDFGYAKEMNME